MAEALRRDAPNILRYDGSVYGTVKTASHASGNVNALPVEGWFETLARHAHTPGRTHFAETGKPYNWSTPRGNGSGSDLEIGRIVHIILARWDWDLYELYADRVADDTVRALVIPHRLATWTGQVIPYREGPGPLYEETGEQHYTGDTGARLHLWFVARSGGFS